MRAGHPPGRQCSDPAAASPVSSRAKRINLSRASVLPEHRHDRSIADAQPFHTTHGDGGRADFQVEAGREVAPIGCTGTAPVSLVRVIRQRGPHGRRCGQAVTHRLQFDTAIASPAAVKIPKTLPIAPQWMIAESGGKWLLLVQQREDGLQLLQILATPRGPLHLALEAPGPDRRQHIKCRGP